MPAPRKYPNELRERAVRLVAESGEQDSGLSLNQAVIRIGQRTGYREGNGRAVRLWIEGLAHEAGHELDCTRSSPERNVHVAMAAANGDYEPMRALLTVAAGGTVGVDREVAALDDLDKLQHGQAWERSRNGVRH